MRPRIMVLLALPLLLLGFTQASSIPGYETFIGILHRIESKVEQLNVALTTSERLVALEHAVASNKEKLKELKEREEVYKEKITRLEAKVNEQQVVIEQHNDYRAITVRMNKLETNLSQASRLRDDEIDAKLKILENEIKDKDLDSLVDQVRGLQREQLQKKDFEQLKEIVHKNKKGVSLLMTTVTELQKNCSCLNDFASKDEQVVTSERLTEWEGPDKEEDEFTQPRSMDESSINATMHASFVAVMDTLQNLTGQLFHVQQEVKCPSPYKMVGGSCIWAVVDHTMLWTGARQFCEDKARYYGGVGDLVVPSDVSAFKDFVSRIDADYLWVGASDAKEEGVWEWISGEAIPSAFLWSPGEPDSSPKQNYMCIKTKPTGSFNDCRNDAEIPFVCHYHLT